jgi:hypothetical protein
LRQQSPFLGVGVFFQDQIGNQSQAWLIDAALST